VQFSPLDCCGAIAWSADTILGMDDELNIANGPDEDGGEGPGLEERLRRGPLPRILLWLALLSGVAWIVSNGLLQIRFAVLTSTAFASEIEAEFYKWAQVVSGIGYTLFVVAVGNYVLLWLAARRREDI
jgi:hypothetical protein